MATYVAMAPGERGGETRALMVRDGFTVAALVFPAFWLFWHRLWIEGAVAFALGLAVAAVGERLGGESLGVALSLLLGLAVALEGPALRIAALRRRGWRERAAIEADSLDDAETRFFAGLARAGSEAVVPAAAPAASPPRRAAPSALGLLGYRN